MSDPTACPICQHQRQWSGPSHEPDCPRRLSIEVIEESVKKVRKPPKALRLHPACKAAYADGATPCARCSWLLGMDTDAAAYVDAHVDDADDMTDQEAMDV